MQALEKTLVYAASRIGTTPSGVKVKFLMSQPQDAPTESKVILTGYLEDLPSAFSTSKHAGSWIVVRFERAYNSLKDVIRISEQ